ncbi:MAG: Fis family transcriptional regulator [Deltaproteobacteria bacterium RBG_13_53_10]|nr:MAG: Fis family transcriptional regulator [Deltaproteobacteria bacterium RBG_13_53_10]
MPDVRILVVDDEEIVCESCKRILEEEGYEVDAALSGVEAFEKMKKHPYDIVLTDLKMPGIDGMEVLKTLRKEYPETIVIMVTGYSTVETAVEAMKLGAFDYIPKPFTPDEVSIVVKKAIEKKSLLLENIYLRQELQEKYGFHNIVGKSKKMQEVYRIIAKVAMTDSTVLIYGQSGTGKELIARAIHFNSSRREKQFVPVDCAVLSENLLESELFGHIRGSFTGAVSTKPGLFEVADGGTLFLDEVGNISLAIQAKLLRVLQEREFTPVGGTKAKKVDIRLIAATNKDLEKMIKEETFREDLYYRLNIVPIYLPSLKERQDDIPLLAVHFLRKYSEEMGKTVKGFTPESMERLARYPWPGNVRELENVIERTVVMIEDEMVRVEHLILPGQQEKEVWEERIPATSDELKEIKKHLREKAVEEIEKAFILSALERHEWNVTRAAEEVGMLRPNFQALMRKYNLTARNRNDQ